jgi:large subunit ribosomal protein L25
MKHPLLVAQERKVLGKQVKKLRREGLLPANVYGKNIPSVSLQVQLADFDKVYKEVGETGLIDLQFNGETRPVLTKNLQMNFRSHAPLHADFYLVNLKEKIKAMVPVLLIGEAQAVTDKVGMLLQTLSDVEIEALPEQLAENIEVAIDHLAALDDHITVGDLKAPEGVTILTDAGQTVAKITELVIEEPEPEVTEETPAEGETAEGEKEATEAAPADEKSEEKKAS